MVKDGLGAVETVLVLGGGSEIGQALARALVTYGARTVVFAARHPDGLAPAARRLREAGASEVLTVPFDADDTPAHDAFVTDVFERVGDVDVVVVAFGVLGDQVTDVHNGAAAASVVHTNLLGAVSVIVPVTDHLVVQGHGTLVVLSSVAGERARRSNFVYGASKAGLNVFCQGLADYLLGTGVDVIVVRPGFVHTRMTAGMAPAPLATTPEKVAGAVVAALRRGGSRTVWTPGALRWVMVALRHLPRRLFRRLPI